MLGGWLVGLLSALLGYVCGGRHSRADVLYQVERREERGERRKGEGRRDPSGCILVCQSVSGLVSVLFFLCVCVCTSGCIYNIHV